MRLGLLSAAAAIFVRFQAGDATPLSEIGLAFGRARSWDGALSVDAVTWN
jgi:hypothetical protein